MAIKYFKFRTKVSVNSVSVDKYVARMQVETKIGYGNMGELTFNRHTYIVPNSSKAFSLYTKWDYDSWNRVKEIVYPDGEDVKYKYNKGGLLKHIEGTKTNYPPTIYIDNINYDQYEQRTFVAYGNGTSTSYSYDPLMRRMNILQTRSSNGQYLLDNRYDYDSVGNIKRITNIGLNPYRHDYTYDDTYQLTSAEGNWNNNQIGYNLSMKYSPSGRITEKNLVGQKYNGSFTTNINYHNNYSYTNTTNPYGVTEINNGSEIFDWDVKGNMNSHKSAQYSGRRNFCWTEDNRLQAVKDKNMGAFYNYDAAGERNLKLNGGTMDVTQNGTTVNVPVLDQQTLYASALITVNDKGYTKHYFEEGKRICSKIGGGYLQDVDKLGIPLSGDIPYLVEYANSLIDKTFGSCMNLIPKIQTNDLYIKTIKPYTNKIYPDESAFYYHSDHLGSSSYITGDNGLATQCLAYMPFGEDFVNIKYGSPKYETPYKFNGKEKDTETGYNYYGARYYSDYLSIFLSVDPLSDKYPNLSSYTYCANNPVMLIDPDGRSAGWYVDEGGNIIGKDQNNDDKLYFVPNSDDQNKVKNNNFLGGVNQKDLGGDVSEVPNYEQRSLLGNLNEKGTNDNNTGASEYGMNISLNPNNGNAGGIMYHSKQQQISNENGNISGGLKFTPNNIIGVFGDSGASGDIIINAHTHNINDGKPHPPTIGADNVPQGIIGIVFDYVNKGGNTYIYNSNTKFKSKSSMKTETFLNHFTTPDGKKL